MSHTQDTKTLPNNTQLAKGANGKDETAIAKQQPYRGFVKGKSGNPSGRPKGRTITSYLRAVLNERDENGRTKADLFAAKMVEFAMRGGRGDAAYAKEVLARVEGGVGADNSLKIQIVYTRQDEGREIIDVPMLAEPTSDSTGIHEALPHLIDSIPEQSTPTSHQLPDAEVSEVEGPPPPHPLADSATD